MATNIFSRLTDHMYKKWGLTTDTEDQIYSLAVIEGDVKFLYAKNFFKSEASREDAILFLFEENRVRTVKFLDDGSIAIETYPLSSIRKVSLNHKDRGFSILKIDFDKDVSITLDSHSDSDHKSGELQKMILEIYKTL
ncbi:DUF3908 family protein [Planococcus sp. YIM B11945]|uniref:DUF3908 family protein n=1 Tax=Planococcus sp. YIM B11945 TaxID=3435410 RepID=UPI003D7D3F18